MIDGVPHLRTGEVSVDESRYGTSVRSRLRRHPLLYRVALLCKPTLNTGPKPGRSLGLVRPESDDLVLDLGSGNDRRHPQFVNIDILAHPEVDVVADAEALPVADGAAAGVLSVAVLEHVRDPERLLREVHRVLRPDGRLFLTAPFIFPFHAAPADFRRWTAPGLTAEVEKGGRFHVVECGTNGGPTSALVRFLAEWLSLVLSFGGMRIQPTLSLGLQAILSPLKVFDLVLGRHPGSSGLAATLYVLAERMN